MIFLLIVLAVITVSGADNVQLYEHRAYTQDEVSDLTWFELCILRNELYAMQGYVFSTEWLAAYFDNQNWYTPSPSFTTASEFPVEFTNEQQANINLFLEAADGLEESVTGCIYSEIEDLTVEYYRTLTYWTELPPLPECYDAYTSVEADPGAYPGFSEEDLLPYGTFNEFYTGWGDALTHEELALLESFGLQDRAVYRISFRPDRTIAKIEMITLMYMEVMGMRDPHTLWTAHYASNSMFIIFVPDCRMDWATRDIALIYTCMGDECVLQAVFKGVYPALKLEIYDGPYSNLPLSITVNSEDIGGNDRYDELWGR